MCNLGWVGYKSVQQRRTVTVTVTSADPRGCILPRFTERIYRYLERETITLFNGDFLLHVSVLWYSQIAIFWPPFHHSPSDDTTRGAVTLQFFINSQEYMNRHYHISYYLTYDSVPLLFFFSLATCMWQNVMGFYVCFLHSSWSPYCFISWRVFLSLSFHRNWSEQCVKVPAYFEGEVGWRIFRRLYVGI